MIKRISAHAQHRLRRPWWWSIGSLKLDQKYLSVIVSGVFSIFFNQKGWLVICTTLPIRIRKYFMSLSVVVFELLIFVLTLIVSTCARGLLKCYKLQIKFFHSWKKLRNTQQILTKISDHFRLTTIMIDDIYAVHICTCRLSNSTLRYLLGDLSLINHPLLSKNIFSPPSYFLRHSKIVFAFSVNNSPSQRKLFLI